MAVKRLNSWKYCPTVIIMTLGLASLPAHASPLQAQADQWDTLYHSEYATWVTAPANLNACIKYKTNIDSIEKELDAAIPVIISYLGIGPEKLPQRVQIDSGTQGMGGWAGGGDVGYQISDFYGAPANGDGLRWIRGVIIGEVINATTGAVTSNWPLDWWVDHVWYFPGFMAGEILKTTISPTFSNYWITSERYPTYPVYNLFESLLGEYGWKFYKDLFARISTDAIKWDNIGANPSKIKTDYVLAYLSLAGGRNLAGEFKRALVEDADSAEVATIMGVEAGLREADKRNLDVTVAWSDFRNGDYASAQAALDKLGISALVRFSRLSHVSGSGHSFPATVYSLTGRKLYTGNNFPTAGLRSTGPSDEFYIFKDKVLRADKTTAQP